MNIYRKLTRWGESHHPWWIDLFRGILGLLIAIKGIYIIRHAPEILHTTTNPDTVYLSMVLVHFIAIFQISGGFAIMVGLMTRLTILAQFPILIAAFFVVRFPGELRFAEMESVLLLLAMMVLFIILVEGPGKHSLDNYLEIHKEKEAK